MSKRRYNEKQVGEILKRSGEIQTGLSPDPDAHGVTLEELQRVASEVGIEPHVVQQAALEVDSGAKGKAASAKVLDHTVDGPVTDEQWEDMVISLRQRTGKSGSTTTQGTTREWTADTDMGSLTLTASTRNGRTRYRLFGDATNVTTAGWILGIAFGFVAVLIMSVILGKKSGLEAGTIAVIAAMASAFVVSLTALLTKGWEKRTQRANSSLFAEIIQIAHAGPSIPAQTSVLVEPEATQPNRA